MAHSGKTITFATDLLPNEDNVYSLGSSSQKWKIQGATVTDRLTTTKSINQIITGTGTAAVDSGSGDNRYKPAKWTFNLGTAAPVDGDIITIKIPVAGHDYGVFLSTNNGTNYYPVVCNGTGRLTTHYPVNTYITVIFESTGSAASMFALAGGTSRVTVSGGVWRVINYYDSNNNDTGYYHRRIYPNLKAGGAIHPYSIIMQLPNGRWSGITTTAPNNPVTGTISPKGTDKAASTSGYVLGHVLVMYARATYADGNNIATYNIWSAHTGLIDARYSFNLANSTGNGFVAYTPVYIVGTVSDGLFYLDTTKWWTQTLPSSDDGKVYIYIGDAYDWYRLTFTEDKPMYWYKNGALRLYAGDAGTVCGLTVQTAVPQNAVFTDTNKYHKTGSWNDLTYTATAVNSADELKFTIPTGTSSTTVAVGNHTHGWANLTNNADSLTEGTSNWTDNTEILTSYASNNGFADTNAKGKVYRRDALCAYNYIKGKLDSVYVAKSAGVTNVAWDSTNNKITKTINGTTSDVVTAATLKSAINVTASDLGLANALHFIGTTSTQLTDGATTSTLTAASTNSLSKTTGFVAGDVVIYSDYEFVWLGNAWEKLGDDSSFKIKQTAITDSTGTSESTTATRFVYSISQDAQGVISVKTRPLPTYNNYSLPLAANGTRGGVQIGYSANGKNYPVQLSSEKMYVNVPWTDTNTKVDQTLDSSSTDTFPLLFSDNKTTVTTATVNTSAKRNNAIYVQPSQSLVAATKYLIGEHVTLQYNSTDSSLDFVFT